MEASAAWLAPAATMIAAMMTASNLGPRLTGWGFVVFTVGSLSWVAVAIRTTQPNLLLTNGFLTLVNLIGVWRWLGRQARYASGGEAAAAQSVASTSPTLASISGLPGAKLTGRNDAPLGVVVDAMMQCAGARLAYIVVSEGGLGGVGERLHALPVSKVRITQDGVACDFAPEDLKACEILDPEAWPHRLRTEPLPSSR